MVSTSPSTSMAASPTGSAWTSAQSTCSSGFWLPARRARGTTRSSRRAATSGTNVDAVRLSNHIGLVASIFVPLVAALLDDLVVPRALLAGSQKPLERVDWADVHADPVGDAAIEVDGDVETMDSEFRRIRVPVGIESLDAVGEDLVVEVGPGLGVFVRLVHEVGVDRFRGKIHFTRHLLASLGRVARP